MLIGTGPLILGVHGNMLQDKDNAPQTTAPIGERRLVSRLGTSRRELLSSSLEKARLPVRPGFCAFPR